MTALQWCHIVEERIKVFVVEQNCPYQEVDQDDYTAHHLLLISDQDQLVGYTRIYLRDHHHATFGRVLVPKQFRGHQYGRKLVQETINATPNLPIKIQAQAYLEQFYQSFGFKPISSVYLEDHIPHLDMVLE